MWAKRFPVREMRILECIQMLGWISMIFMGLSTLSFSAPVGDCLPGTFKLYHVDSRHARCIDGSPATFYYRKGLESAINKWLIFFEGGAWCENNVECRQRSGTPLGSSQHNPSCTSDRSAYYMEVDSIISDVVTLLTVHLI